MSTGIYTQLYTAGELRAKVLHETGLIFTVSDGHAQIHIPGLPAGVAAATAEAFNRAMNSSLAGPDSTGAETATALDGD